MRRGEPAAGVRSLSPSGFVPASCAVSGCLVFSAGSMPARVEPQGRVRRRDVGLHHLSCPQNRCKEVKDCVSLCKRAAISLIFTKLHRFARNYAFFHSFARAIQLPVVFGGIPQLYNTGYCRVLVHRNCGPMRERATPFPRPRGGDTHGGRPRPTRSAQSFFRGRPALRKQFRRVASRCKTYQYVYGALSVYTALLSLIARLHV
jgi:hypothetical protein